mgnify:CR=1 FL=1
MYLAFTQNLGNYVILAFFMIARLMKNKTQLHVLLPVTLHSVDRVVEVSDRRCHRRGGELSHREGLRVHHDPECDAVRRHVYSDGCSAVVDLPPHEVHLSPLVAVFLCLLGLAIMIISDAKKAASEGTHRVIGDIMALSASVLYAVSNLCQEIFVKSDDWVCVAITQ